MFVRLLPLIFFWLVCVLNPSREGIAYAGEPSENQIKAVFIYNFVKFVEWPSHVFQSPDSPIVICTLGQDGLTDAIDTLSGRTAQGRKLVLKPIGRPAQADHCHVVYVARSEKGQFAAVLRPTREAVLTVGDMRGFAANGGIINFAMAENRITFEVNVDAVARAGLRLSSQLVKLARVVREDSAGEGK